MASTDPAVLEDILPGVGDLYLYQINRVRALLLVLFWRIDHTLVSSMYVSPSLPAKYPKC